MYSLVCGAVSAHLFFSRLIDTFLELLRNNSIKKFKLVLKLPGPKMFKVVRAINEFQIPTEIDLLPS